MKATSLIDTGSSDSFLNLDFAVKHNLTIYPEIGRVSMASSLFTSNLKGYCIINLDLLGNNYPKWKMSVLSNLCTDVIIGHDIMKLHDRIDLVFGGPKPPLSICCLTAAHVKPPSLFGNLTDDCKPIATKRRKYSEEDERFIREEIKKLLEERIIEESISPWRAQVVVTKNENHKRRMVVDYSQTINKFTLLDAYPLPNIEDIVGNVAKYKIFSTIDLKSAYHQIPICDEDKPYTAFEAAGRLYQFTRIPFGVTNGVATFQRIIDSIIKEEKLVGVYAYLDDVTVCGEDQSSHDLNLDKFIAVVNKYGLTLNEKKCSYSKTTINLLGYTIQNKTLKPDLERLKPLQDLPIPQDNIALRRIVGMFAHYAKWIPKFSDKIRSLINCKTFPLPDNVINDFQTLKRDVASSLVWVIDEKEPLVVETDASDYAIAATLNQLGRPVAFFSRTLSQCERRHSSVEKEAYAIVEAIKKWRHFLMGRYFKLITDQEAVSFMFNSKHASKIKNEKILRWRLELSSYCYDIVYRPGNQNASADMFSRICGAINHNELLKLHEELCHPGITRMYHLVRSRNLPYSLDDVKRISSSCPVCAEIKPRFVKNSNSHLIKATSPFERLNIDFKGPLPSATSKKYMLTIVDEYSRFPFAFPCSDMNSSTVIDCLVQVFSIFGLPSYIHSDRGRSFISNELVSFLHARGIATSRTTPYNPQGNGQVERYNGIIWKNVTLALKTRKLKITQWELVLPDVLHAIRSLLCTTTNCTPHERMFNHHRRCTYGTTMPSWLRPSSTVFLRKGVRNSKYDAPVEEVELIETNPQYALVRYKDGREGTVAVKHLAPLPGRIEGSIEEQRPEADSNASNHEATNASNLQMQEDQPPMPTELRRSSRSRHCPDYLKDYVE